MNINVFYQDEVAHVMRQTFEAGRASYPGLTYRTDVEKEGFPLVSIYPAYNDFVKDAVKWVTAENDLGERWAKGAQFTYAIQSLKHGTRPNGTVIISWDLWTDGFLETEPLRLCSSFLKIISGRLHMTNMLASCDMIDDFPHDVALLALMQMLLAQELGVKPGILSVTMGQAFIKAEDSSVTKGILSPNVTESVDRVELDLPPDSLKRIKEFDNTLLIRTLPSAIGKTAQPHT